MNQTDFGLIRNFTADAAIGVRRIVAFAAVPGRISEATAANVPPVGVTGIIGAAAAGERVDVYMDGNREVIAGGAFAQGDPVCADDQGRAIKCEAGWAVGIALEASSGEGQIVTFTISRTHL